jgi:hypothetical protein
MYFKIEILCKHLPAKTNETIRTMVMTIKNIVMTIKTIVITIKTIVMTIKTIVMLYYTFYSIALFVFSYGNRSLC